MTKTYREALERASSLLEAAGLDPDGAAYVMADRHDWSRTQLMIHGRDPMTTDDAMQFAADLERLQQGEPAQYITGRAPFWSAMFHVDQRVLIPRFDTELLIEWVLEDKVHGDVLDLATGSGAIGISLKLEQPEMTVTLADLSHDALDVAAMNAKTLDADVTLVQSNLLTAIPGQFDCIVSNLPYIDRAEMPVMDTSTKTYEPDLALYADDHGLALFRALLPTLPAHIRPGGAVYLEFGYHQKAALAAMITELLPDQLATFRQDLAGLDRAVKIQF